MSQYGQSHRELVQDTNQGTIHTPVQERASSQATVQARDTQRIGDQFRGAQALVEFGQTAFEPINKEQQRRRERDAYDAAGKEEGRQAADAAAGAWHNKLFGPEHLQRTERRKSV